MAQTSNRIQSLTMGEVAVAERAAGLGIATLEDPNFPKGAILGALAWVLKKREDATLTHEAFMDSATMDEVAEILGLTDVDDSGN